MTTTVPDAPPQDAMSGRRPLPDGWRWARLGELLRLRKDVLHPHDKPVGKGVFVGLEHIESGTGRKIGSEEVDFAKLTGRKPRFYPGDIVYGYLRPYLNKVWIADREGLCSVDQYVYSVDSSMADTQFIAWFMRSPIYLATAPINVTPGQLPRIRTEEVASVHLALPPPTEQRRIAALLSEQMAAVERARVAAQAQLEVAKALPAAFLRAVFESEEAHAWPKVRIGSLARVQSGYAFKSNWFSSDGIKLLRNANVFQGYISWADVMYLSAERRSVYQSYELAVGDIVLSGSHSQVW
jgi:type I restriction enzyme, S subunit